MINQGFVRLGEIVEEPPRRGIQRKDDGVGPSVPFVETRLVNDGRGRIERAPSGQSLSSGVARNTRKGDLLLVNRGLAPDRQAACAVVEFEEPAAFSPSLTQVRLDRSRAVPHYVRLYFTSKQGSAALVAASSGTVVSNLKPANLAEIEIKLPSLSYQQEIVEAMAELEEQMAKVESLQETLYASHETLREGLINGVLEISPRARAASE